MDEKLLSLKLDLFLGHFCTYISTYISRKISIFAGSSPILTPEMSSRRVITYIKHIWCLFAPIYANNVVLPGDRHVETSNFCRKGGVSYVSSVAQYREQPLKTAQMVKQMHSNSLYGGIM